MLALHASSIKEDPMLNCFRIGAIAATVLFAAASSASAQTPPPTPTTRILAIGTLTPGADPQLARRILPSEMRATAQLYLDGKIDQWYSLQGRIGVAFILNVTDPKAAEAMLEALPLGQAHLMTFELTPLGPLNPLRQLLAAPGAQ
jgi:Muconolactone delta-isomerase